MLNKDLWGLWRNPFVVWSKVYFMDQQDWLLYLSDIFSSLFYIYIHISSFWISVILQALTDKRLQKDRLANKHVLWQMCARDPKINSCPNQPKSSDIKRNHCKNIIYSITSWTYKINRNSIEDKILFHFCTQFQFVTFRVSINRDLRMSYVRDTHRRVFSSFFPILTNSEVPTTDRVSHIQF